MNEEKTKQFLAVLVQCLEDVISGLLGEGAKKAVVTRLEKDTGLQIVELIGRIAMLKNSLEEIFGRSGPVLERMIAKQIYRKLDLDTPPHEFEAAIAQAKRAYMEVS